GTNAKWFAKRRASKPGLTRSRGGESSRVTITAKNASGCRDTGRVRCDGPGTNPEFTKWLQGPGLGERNDEEGKSRRFGWDVSLVAIDDALG
ncbi:hypothetical protein CTA2_1117, partial [Colletotrichum tanaceti]